MKFVQKKTFVAWLESRKPSEIIGKGCSTGECPLSTFLRYRGAAAPYVRPDVNLKDSCWRMDHNARATLPAWANTYALAIDRCGETHLPALAALAIAKMLKLA